MVAISMMNNQLELIGFSATLAGNHVCAFQRGEKAQSLIVGVPLDQRVVDSGAMAGAEPSGVRGPIDSASHDDFATERTWQTGCAFDGAVLHLACGHASLGECGPTGFAGRRCKSRLFTLGIASFFSKLVGAGPGAEFPGASVEMAREVCNLVSASGTKSDLHGIAPV